MMILMGDTVTIRREVAGEPTFVTGRVSGIVQNDNGDLRYFYIRGLDTALWMSDGWQFEEEYTIEDEGDDDNG